MGVRVARSETSKCLPHNFKVVRLKSHRRSSKRGNMGGNPPLYPFLPRQEKPEEEQKYQSDTNIATTYIRPQKQICWRCRQGAVISGVPRVTEVIFVSKSSSAASTHSQSSSPRKKKNDPPPSVFPTRRAPVQIEYPSNIQGRCKQTRYY